jgi:hypothetical protein
MFQHPPQLIPSQHLPPAQSAPRPLSSVAPVPDIKGGDPGYHDMSNPRVCLYVRDNIFLLTCALVHDLKLGPQLLDKEDIAVGSHGLISGRDASEAAFQHDVNKWVLIPMRNSTISSPNAAGYAPPLSVFLPKDRELAQYIANIYFERLNSHRPVFLRDEFELNSTRASRSNMIQASHAPCILCSRSGRSRSSTTVHMDRTRRPDPALAEGKLIFAQCQCQDPHAT